MIPSQVKLGNQAENLALQHLQQQGLSLLSRNYRCKGGELDLVMRAPDGTIVFVEVRYRRQAHHGGALESIDWRKQRRLLHAASHYLQRYRLSNQPCRIDVLAIQGGISEQPQIEWLRNAIQHS